MSRIAARLIVRGRVQGVGYRAWACALARRLQLDGWVRNRSDGTVELVAAGDPDSVDLMEDACRRGPPAAHVAAVERTGADDEGVCGFEARRTL
jgi:acylphosphatase